MEKIEVSMFNSIDEGKKARLTVTINIHQLVKLKNYQADLMGALFEEISDLKDRYTWDGPTEPMITLKDEDLE